MNLQEEVNRLGKPAWREMLVYVADLHRQSIHPARPPFPHDWEDIGPGYCYGPAFGHWDIVHQVMDWMPTDPEHVARQIENLFAVQQADGFMPGATRWAEDGTHFLQMEHSHPPVWVFAVEDHHEQTGDLDLIGTLFEPGCRQFAWFEKQRRSKDGGYFYCDVTRQTWESGVDEGVRFDRPPPEPLACVDATAHVHALASHLALWAERLGEDPSHYAQAATSLKNFVCDELFDPETGFFHDAWAVGEPERRCLAFEGIWPVVVGAAEPEQARRVVEENLMVPDRFLSSHPIPTVALCDPKFEHRMWRGPTWNSMTYWAARGCLAYGHRDAAAELVGRALDASARWFGTTGEIYEFYHPTGGAPDQLQRKPVTEQNAPCTAYLGHNPLIAMARLYDTANQDHRADPPAR